MMGVSNSITWTGVLSAVSVLLKNPTAERIDPKIMYFIFYLLFFGAVIISRIERFILKKVFCFTNETFYSLRNFFKILSVSSGPST